MDNPLISVIVPVYKVEKYLDRCVESIVNQTYKNLEIILVDDGSPDNCPQMCDAWAEKDSRIKVIHKENGGVSSARNLGLDEANGELISFVDSDDYCKQNMLRIMYEKITESAADVLAAHVVDYNKYEIGFFEKEEILKRFFEDKLCHPGIHGKLYKKTAILDNRFDETKPIGEDYFFNYHVLKNINAMVIIVDEVYYYNRDNVTSVTYTLKEEWIRAYKNTKYILQEEKNSDLYECVLLSHANVLSCKARQMMWPNYDNMSKTHFDEISLEIKTYYKEFKKLRKRMKFKVRVTLSMIYYAPALSARIMRAFFKFRSYMNGKSFN